MNDKLRVMQHTHESRQLAKAFNQNSHTLVVMMPEEFTEFMLLQKKKSGLTDEQIVSWLDGIIASSNEISQATKQKWSQQKSKIKTVGSFSTCNV